MMKSLMLVLLAVLVSACGAPIRNASALKIRVGSDAIFPPYESLGADQKTPVGFDMDVFQAIADRAGWNVEFYNVGATTLLPFVQRCQIDAAISMIPITPMLSQVLVSEPYYRAPNVIVVKKGNLVIDDVGKLAGMVVGAEQAMPSENIIRTLPQTKLQSYANEFSAFQDLALGGIDAVIADKPRARYAASIPSNSLKIVGANLGQVDYGIVVCQTKPELLQSINAGIASIQADGTLERLQQKWNVSNK